MSGGASAEVLGVVWQPDAATMRPQGEWQRLGARELLIQWTAVPGKVLLGRGSEPAAADRIDAAELARQPWARSVILGLAGDPDQEAARRSVSELAALSRDLARRSSGLTVSGWYFPVELDPTWRDVSALREALQTLPRPLWISVYDNANVGAQAVVDQVRRAVPPDVGLLFQDGVGVYARTPETAAGYVQALRRAFGRKRVRIIAEAFRATPEGFRSATADELAAQLRAYPGTPVYLFDGPHYLSPRLTAELAVLLVGSSGLRSLETVGR